jgi:chromosome segregation ATPase
MDVESELQKLQISINRLEEQHKLQSETLKEMKESLKLGVSKFREIENTLITLKHENVTNKDKLKELGDKITPILQVQQTHTELIISTKANYKFLQIIGSLILATLGGLVAIIELFKQ